jgi:hypothetical protein
VPPPDADAEVFAIEEADPAMQELLDTNGAATGGDADLALDADSDIEDDE